MSISNGTASRSPSVHTVNGVPFDTEVFDKVYSLVANISTSRQEWLRRKLSTDPRRDIYDECGFQKSPTSEIYRDLFDRDPIAGRVVDFMPKECFSVTPYVYEEESGDEPTEFEEAWDEVGSSLRGEFSWYKKEKSNPIWEYMLRADIYSGIGSYGVILLGFNDAKGEEGLSKPVKRGKGRELKFIRVFPDTLAEINTYEADINSPRFGLPLEYNISFNDPRDARTASSMGMTQVTKRVHWTRVIHIAEDLSSNEVHGTPRMKGVLNNIASLQKVWSADAEGYWKACFTILSAETHPSLGGDEVEINKTEMRDMFEAMMNGLQRYGVFQGMTLKSIAPAVTDPTPHIAAQIDLICIRKGWPIRIFKGSERGELASSQDERAHKIRTQERRDNYITPKILIPTIDRLIWAGVLPEPSEEGYCIEWPDISTETEAEKATVFSTQMDGLSKYIGGGVDAMIPPKDILVDFLDIEDEKADAWLEAAVEHQEEKLNQEIEQTKAKVDEGVMPDPSKPMLPPGKGVPPGKGAVPPGGAKPAGKPPFVKNEDGKKDGDK